MIRKKDGSISPLKLILTIILCLIVVVGSFFGGFFVDRLVANRDLSSVSWAKSIIEKHYLYDYFSYSENAIDGLVSGLDEYSAYFTAEEYAKELADRNGNKSGLGVTYSLGKEGGVLLVKVVGNSPAWKAGLRDGDIITSGIYKGVTTTFGEDALDKFSTFMNGISANEDFTLVLSGEESITVSKQEYTAAYAYMSTNTTSWQYESDGSNLKLVERSEDKLDFLPDGYAYISLSQFYGSATDQMKYLIEKFNAEEESTLILDLRNNGGGYLDVMNGIAGLFVDCVSERKVSTKIQYKDTYSTVNCTPSSVYLDQSAQVYVLANSGTASASEALMGVLISYEVIDYADIYLSDYSTDYLEYAKDDKNKQTYGKGIMQTTYVNITGEALKLTTAQLYWANGKTIHGVGITTEDGCKSVSTDWIMTSGDGELKDAVQLIVG